MKALLSLFVAITVASCAGGAARHSQEMDALVGKGDKSYFVNKYGPPDKQATVSDGIDVWEWRLNEQKFVNKTGQTNAYSFSTFERMRLTFSGGVLSSWSRAKVTE